MPLISQGTLWVWLLASWFFVCGALSACANEVPAVVEAIRREALRPNLDEGGRPLPLASHWNTGHGHPTGTGFSPEWAVELIRAGHHVLPWAQIPDYDRAYPSTSYYAPAWKQLAEWKLPITLIGTQFERPLGVDKRFRDRPMQTNPNAYNRTGERLAEVDPFGPVEPWREVGALWAGSSRLRELVASYPDPPLVLFLSNNEHPKLRWRQADESRRFLDAIGPGRSDEEKRQRFGDSWIVRYRALQDGFRSQLPAEPWRSHARFIAYNAFGPWMMGRWPRWYEQSLSTADRSSPWPLAWDGASPPFYLHHWDPSTDDTVWSPQVHACNWVPMLDEARRLNPAFWFELSTWDGHQPGKETDKRAFFAKHGQTYTAERYEGMVQFGMWLTRPRVVREYRGHLETRAQAQGYFDAVIRAVDRVHRQPLLRDYWQQGRLVPNSQRPHPFSHNLPANLAKADRWYLLETDLMPTTLNLSTVVPVFALALELGQTPERRWLLYAHAPRGDVSGVRVTLPGYGDVELNASIHGTFTEVTEAGRKVTALVSE